MSVNLRQERIERLLEELRYEVTRGMMEREIDESLGFRFIVPVSASIPGGVVQCEFRTRPITLHMLPFDVGTLPKLRVINGDRS